MDFVAPIVEGHGEVEAVPALLYRILETEKLACNLRVNPPIRVKASSFLRDEGYFRKYVALAAEKAAQQRGAVLVLLDCEDACPAELGPDLLRRAKSVRDDVVVLVALAYREYETWFVAAAESLRGLQGLSQDSEAPRCPEKIRDAKGWLGERMRFGYDPLMHQRDFTKRFDLQKARANHSFNRLYKRLTELLRAAKDASRQISGP